MVIEDGAVPPDVAKNILYVFRFHPAAERKRQALAKQIGVATTTISRWFNYTVIPRQAQLENIAAKFSIDFDDLQLPHKVFVEKVSLKYPAMDQAYRNTKRSISLPAIAKWRFLWRECAEKYTGTYLLYNLRSKPSGKDAAYKVAVSLLTIEQETEQGITFSLWNVDNESADQLQIQYEYKGLLFPIFDVLCFYGDEASGNEPFSMILRSSQTSPPSLMLGHVLAVNVRPELRTPGTGKVAVLWQGKKVRPISDLKGKIGIFDDKAISASITQALLS